MRIPAPALLHTLRLLLGPLPEPVLKGKEGLLNLKDLDLLQAHGEPSEVMAGMTPTCHLILLL